MWKMIIGQAIFQLSITLTLYFAGAQILGYQRGDEQRRLELNTLIFNTFVWMQIFNELNNRRLDNRLNIFEGVQRNKLFIFINLLMVGLQIAIIFVGGRAFEINPAGLHGTQWAISIIVAIMCLPWAVVVRLFPDAWFARAVAVAGGPVVVAYRALGRIVAAALRPLRRLKRNGGKGDGGDDDDRRSGASGAEGSPTILVSEAPVLHVTDLEKGR